MINQYRTLLLNLSDLGNPNEYISPGFNALILPDALQGFYNLLYPTGASRYYKQFIAYYIERLLHGTNQITYLTSFDSRITYDLSDLGEYFAVSRVSNPGTANFNFSILVTGDYNLTPSINSYYEGFTISQVGSSNNILVYSNTQNLYLNGSMTSTSAQGMSIPVTFANGMSNLFPIGTTGLNARIVGNGANFGAYTNQMWTFVAEAPFSFSFTSFYNDFYLGPGAVNSMINYGPADPSNLAMWQQHFNPVYRLAALFNMYILKVNALWQAQSPSQ